MSEKDHGTEGRPGAFSPSPTPQIDGSGAVPVPEGTSGPSEGLASHFVRRTDNDFHGIKDPSLIGEDIGDDLVDENGDPIEE